MLANFYQKNIIEKPKLIFIILLICLVGFGYNSKNYNLPKIDKSGYSKKILDHLNKIKFGKIEDKFGWVTKL